jgi:hypothetical protein
VVTDAISAGHYASGARVKKIEGRIRIEEIDDGKRKRAAGRGGGQREGRVEWTSP